MNRLVKIGIFIIITSTSLTYYVMKTTDSLNYGNIYELTAYMNDASGLYKESKVKLAGVAIGQIKKIELSGKMAKLTLQISEDVKIYKDAVIAKSLESMLGTYVLTISPGKDTNNPLMEGDTVEKVLGDGIMTEMLASTQGVSEEANLLLQDLRAYYTSQVFSERILTLIDELNTSNLQTRQMVNQNMVIMSGMLESLAVIASKGEGNTDAAINRMAEILDNITILTASLNEISTGRDEQLAGILANLQESTDTLSLTMQNLQKTTGAIEAGEGTVGKLLTDESLYNEIMDMSQLAKDYVNSSLGLKIQVAASSEYMVMNSEAKNHFNARFIPPDSNKYYQVGFVDTNLTQKSTTNTETTITSSDGVTNNQNYTTKEESSSDKLKLTAILARTYGPVTLRGGLLEGTAGAGIDYQPLNQFSVSGEIFDFGNDQLPYLRTYATIYPFFDPDKDNPLNWVYINAGADNVLRDNRDYFVGAGLRFTDNDIKALIGNIPSVQP